MSTERGRFGRDVLVSFGFVALQLSLAMGNSIIVARMVGPEGRGLYGLAVAILALAWPLAALGQQGSTVYFIGKGRPAGAVAGLNLLLALALIPLGLGTASVAWFAGGEVGNAAALAIVAAAVCLPAAVHFETTRHDFLGRKLVLAYNLCQTALTATLLVLNLLLLDRGAQWVLVALVASWLGVTAVLGLIRGLGRPRIRLPSRELVRESLRYGLREAGSRFSEAALMRVDVLILAPIVGLAALGVFAIADQIATLLAWPGVVAGRMMFAHSSQDGEGGEARAKLGLAVRMLVVLGVVSALACVALMGWLIPLVFTDAFSAAYVGLLILLPGAVAKSLHMVVGKYLAGQGHQRPVVRAGVAALVIDVVLIVALAPTFGWEAAAVAKTAAHVFQLIVVVVADRRLHPDQPLSLVPTVDDARAVTRWIRQRISRSATKQSNVDGTRR